MKIIFGQKANSYSEKSAGIRAQIDAIITAPDFAGEIDFQGVRDAAGKTATEWPDGYIHQAALDMGLTVQTDDL